MLTFNLKKEWYEKIKRGEKTVEYREVKPYWTKRLNTEFNSYSLPLPKTGVAWRYEDWPQPHTAILRLGYTKRHMTVQITKLEVVDGKDTDLAVDAPVYAIHLANVREMVQCPHCKGNGAMLGDGLGVMECPWCGGDGEWEA